MLIEKVLKLEEDAKNDLLLVQGDAKTLLSQQEEKAKEWARKEYAKWQEELKELKVIKEKELLAFTKEMEQRQTKLVESATSVDSKAINKLVDELLKQVTK